MRVGVRRVELERPLVGLARLRRRDAASSSQPHSNQSSAASDSPASSGFAPPSKAATRRCGATFAREVGASKSKRICPDSGCQRRGAVLDHDPAPLHGDAHRGQRPALGKLLPQPREGRADPPRRERAAIRPRAVRRKTRSGKENRIRRARRAPGTEIRRGRSREPARERPEEPGDLGGGVARHRRLSRITDEREGAGYPATVGPSCGETAELSALGRSRSAAARGARLAGLRARGSRPSARRRLRGGRRRGARASWRGSP